MTEFLFWKLLNKLTDANTSIEIVIYLLKKNSNLFLYDEI